MRQRNMLDILAEAIMEAARKDEKVKDIIKEILEFDNVDDKSIFTFNARLARFLEDAKDDGCECDHDAFQKQMDDTTPNHLNCKSVIDDVSSRSAMTGKSYDDNDLSSGMAVIDGHNLSPNEIAFEEHCMDRFDEDAWLADHNLSAPEDGHDAA